ncbi:MAG: pilin [Xanthomonadaceae bacterium]|nr:pilin [Xanthomonadaceae bacterium]
MKKQQGFTLIELMIVVAIVAILAAIALPAAQDFLTRARVSEALATAGTCKTSVSEYYASEGVLPADINQAGCTNIQTRNVDATSVAAGVITVTLGNVGRGQQGNNIVLTPTVGVVPGAITEWVCTYSGAEKQFVPASCR